MNVIIFTMLWIATQVAANGNNCITANIIAHFKKEAISIDGEITISMYAAGP